MKPLTDKFGRQLDYLRLSVTDRCNFRCTYCMPEHGAQFTESRNLLTFDELYFLSKIFCGLGVTKIRITGGEPFVRKGVMPFLQQLSLLNELKSITITTNASLIAEYIEALKMTGITGINVSLDSLDRQRFQHITKRNDFEMVYTAIIQLLKNGFEVKLNCVVCDENIEDVIPLVELTKQHKLTVRFLEAMPFNGSEIFVSQWNYKQLHCHIEKHFGGIQKINDEPNSTSINFKVTGYAGTFGIIPSFSRTFCGTCNRIRLSATGELRTCLYGAPAANLRDSLRSGASNVQIENEILNAVTNRVENGFEAEALQKKSPQKSMAAIGG